MQVFCPGCGASAEVDPAAKSASCAQCGAGIPVQMPAFGPPGMGPPPRAFGLEEMAAARPVPAAAPAFQWSEVRGLDGAWLVRVRGRGPGCLAALALGLIVLASIELGSSKSDVPAGAVVLGAVGLWFGYLALCRAVNTGTLRVDREALTFVRGPVPQWGNARVPTQSIAGFMAVRRGSIKTGGTRRILWGLRMVTDGGGVAWLPLGLDQRDHVDFAIERLTQMVSDFGGAMPAQRQQVQQLIQQQQQRQPGQL
ncbi:MAG TPA: hypothetical protein VIF15_11865 [Polyangiaceae bacterium]